MRRFVLRCTYNGNTLYEWFKSTSDREAVVDGAFLVMRFAAWNDDPLMPGEGDYVDAWTNGCIELINDMDVVLATMPARRTALLAPRFDLRRLRRVVHDWWNDV